MAVHGRIWRQAFIDSQMAGGLGVSAACARRTARGRVSAKKSRTCVPLARYSQQTRRSKCVAASSGCFAWAIGFPHTTPVLNLFARIRFMSRLLCTNKSIRWYCKQTSMHLPCPLLCRCGMWGEWDLRFDQRARAMSHNSIQYLSSVWLCEVGVQLSHSLDGHP